MTQNTVEFNLSVNVIHLLYDVRMKNMIPNLSSGLAEWDIIQNNYSHVITWYEL